jgi:hypothetical protein
VTLPDTIQNLEQLEDLLSEPTSEVVQTLGRLEGDLIVLGVAGKMGPSLARMARRASELAGSRRRIIGVARFSSAGLEAELRRQGLFEDIWCLDPREGLSPGESEEIDRVCAAYPHLNDDVFVAARRERRLGA